MFTVKGNVMRASEKTHDMYASIDKVTDSMKRKLRKFKERVIDAHRQGKPDAADFELDEIEDYKLYNAEVEKSLGPAPDVPPVNMAVVKKKSFPMDPITVRPRHPTSPSPNHPAPLAPPRAPPPCAARMNALYLGALTRAGRAGQVEDAVLCLEYIDHGASLLLSPESRGARRCCAPRTTP